MSSPGSPRGAPAGSAAPAAAGPPAPRAPAVRRLPLLLLAALLAIAVAIEATAYGRVDWAPKLPLAVLLALPWLAGRRVRPTR